MARPVVLRQPHRPRIIHLNRLRLIIFNDSPGSLCTLFAHETRLERMDVVYEIWIAEFETSAVGETHRFDEAMVRKIGVGEAVLGGELFHDFEDREENGAGCRGGARVEGVVAEGDRERAARDDGVGGEVGEGHGSVGGLDGGDQGVGNGAGVEGRGTLLCDFEEGAVE